jgi:hypothetical protein
VIVAERFAVTTFWEEFKRLASQLVFGDADRPIVQFEAAGLVALLFRDGHWMITCVVDSELLP